MLWHAFALLAHGGDRLGLRPTPARRAPRPAATPAEVARVTERLETAIWTATALATAVETGLVAALRTPLPAADLARRCGQPEPVTMALVDVLVGLGFAVRTGETVSLAPGVAGALNGSGPGGLAAMLDGMRLQADDFRHRAAAGRFGLDGWTHTDERVILAQGHVTAAHVERAIPKLRFLPGLLPRLQGAGGRLLDVGAGAAALSITLCRAFPTLAAVALEPAPAPAAIGEERIRASGLSDRIELRRQRVEALAENEIFDLAFLPQMFLRDDAIAPGVERIFAALKPGGWLLAPVLSRRGGDLPAATARLRNIVWGANTRDELAVRDLLAAAGFEPVIRAPGRDGLRMICARKPARA
jgi:SAM-dependent methyltransferase